MTKLPIELRLRPTKFFLKYIFLAPSELYKCSCLSVSFLNFSAYEANRAMQHDADEDDEEDDEEDVDKEEDDDEKYDI